MAIAMEPDNAPQATLLLPTRRQSLLSPIPVQSIDNEREPPTSQFPLFPRQLL
jgi:hypothetical protein